ncbi:hypothetical protein NA57DRAFT_23747, partial [Rhizodiscina lignyota]
MQYLVDPLKFSDHINRLLKKNDLPQAYALVQYASKSMNCVVSWNSLIVWCLNNGKMSTALKIYNEMKKRAQWPDSYTYMHLLRGLGSVSHQPSSVPKAVSIYHSMFADNARTKPTPIHLNMVVKACARAGDMDALWGVVSTIGKSGPRPDSITYNIILNAIQRHAIESLPSNSNDAEAARHFDRAVLQGRRIWVDIVEQWRKMELAMHDTLVCAMGRLLLLSWRPRDWDDILSLLEQTENVQRVVPRLGTPAHSHAAPTLNDPSVILAEMEADMPDESLSSRGQEFDHARKDHAGNLIFAHPTNNTLSLVLEACLKLTNKKAADGYWKLFTESTWFNIKPDNDNFNFYLRILRQNKSSGQAMRLVQNDMRDAIPLPKTFRIAMSACARNVKNAQAVEHAVTLITLMAERLDYPDFHPLNTYVKLA